MSVEWKVGTVNSQIVVQQQPQHFIAFTWPRMACIPEQAMMDDEQIGLGVHGHLNGGEAAIDRCGQARDATSIFHLEAIAGAVIILELILPQQPVAVLGDRSQWNVRHQPMKSRVSLGGQEILTFPRTSIEFY